MTAEEISALGFSSGESHSIYREVVEILEEHGASLPETWREISSRILTPDQPFSLHQMMFYGCYAEYQSDAPPAWIPKMEDAVLTNVGSILEKHGKDLLGLSYKDPISSFADFQKYSVSHPEEYWKLVLNELKISFHVPPVTIFREHISYPGGQWLPEAVLNSAENCFCWNGRRDKDDIAVIWRDEGCDNLPLKHMTFKELHEQISLVANSIETLSLDKGSAIAIDMPMTVTSVVIYLAIVLAGYVVVSIADSFAPNEISVRLKISNAKAIFTQDHIIRSGKNLPLYSKVVEAHSPAAIVVPARASVLATELRAFDVSWDDFLGRIQHSRRKQFSAVHQSVEEHTNILFSSGTTGEPKAIPWTHATPLKVAADAWCHMDIKRGDVIAWPTNLGWMMGPWLVYASLLNGASMALYNGSPLGSTFAKFIQDAKVTMLGVIPSIVRAWKNTNITTGFDWSSIRCFGSTGEASSIDENLWLIGRARFKPIIEYCGGTEIGGAFVTGSLLQPQSLAAFSTPAMGHSLIILGDDGNPLPPGVPGIGELALYPNMLGSSTKLLNADHYKVYFKDMPVYKGKVLRRHGDEFELLSSGYYRAHGRVDDTMNLGGIKVSSVEMERICNGIDDAILETAAVSVPPSRGGPERLVIAVVLKNSNGDLEGKLEELKKLFNSSLQKKLNPLFKVSSVVLVPSLPRTASNKIMRRVLRQEILQSQLHQKSKF